MIVLFWASHILSEPSYITSIDQTYVKISGKNEIIQRAQVIKECSLDRLEILEIIEGIVEIGSESFKSASKLSKVILPINLKTLGSHERIKIDRPARRFRNYQRLFSSRHRTS